MRSHCSLNLGVIFPDPSVHLTWPTLCITAVTRYVVATQWTLTNVKMCMATLLSSAVLLLKTAICDVQPCP